jgi:ketosteroid isomerase-like protein
MKAAYLMAPLAMLVVAVANAAVATDPHRIARDNLQLWSEALQARAIDRLDGLYTQDAIVITPAGQPAAGIDSVRAFWNARILGGLETPDVEIENAYGSDDRVYVYGRWSARRVGMDGIAARGRFVTVIERQPDGSWKTRYQSWN